MRFPRLKQRESALAVVNIDTLCAFDEYTATVSWARVTGTCVFAMAPAFVATILIELMPLASLETGWASNWVLGLRCFFTSLFTSLGICMQFHTFAPDAGLSMKSTVLIATGAASGFAIGLVPLVKYWSFPIPFTIVVGTPIWMFSFVSCSLATIGWSNVRENQLLREQFGLILSVTSVQCLMLAVYPLYNVGFIALSGMSRLGFVLVLPAIKYFMKWLLNWVAGHTEAGIVLVMTSADLFEALYLIKCMQSAGSINSGFALIVVDLIQNVFHLHGLHHKVRLLEESLKGKTVQLDGQNLVRSFIKMSQAPAPHQRLIKRKADRNVVHPLPANSSAHTSVMLSIKIPNKAAVNASDGKVEDLILECQEVLLVEFIESAVPIFYCLYLVILFHLPNAKYYPEMQNMSRNKLHSLVGNIAIYASLELVSLIYVHLILKWRFNLSALHLLAFTLKSERIILQGTFVAWVVLNLQFTLVHFGADFTFHFEWMT